MTDLTEARDTDLHRLRERVAELETERAFLRQTLGMAMHYAIQMRVGALPPAREADVYLRLLDAGTDALRWSYAAKSKQGAA